MTDQGRPDSGTSDVADRINVLEQIVADHRRAGLSEDEIKSKASYKELQSLKSTTTV